jgi:hypothetical protein
VLLALLDQLKAVQYPYFLDNGLQLKFSQLEVSDNNLASVVLLFKLRTRKKLYLSGRAGAVKWVLQGGTIDNWPILDGHN